jgi:SulP family sulfate permease
LSRPSETHADAPPSSSSDGEDDTNVRRIGIRKQVAAPAVDVASLGAQHAGYLAQLKHDLPASVVVFLVALPLCLGIAVASGAPPLAGLIAGIVGGVLVAWTSGSHVAVSGPAAGLTVIVLGGIQQLGYEAFLLALCIAGVMQVALGVLRTGIFAYYFPSSVIKGMLAAIGVILILKQIPHALGSDADFEGNETLRGQGQLGPLDAIWYAINHVHWGAALMAGLGLVVLLVMGHVPALRKLRWLPAPLVVVLLGIGLNALFGQSSPGLALDGEHLVRLPDEGVAALWAALPVPDFSAWQNMAVYQVALTLAIVASLETLLCVEAMDKLDPYKRSTPTNRELLAQGTGNLVSGLLGGLPMTAVIVRGSANIQSGGRTRMSAFLHGILLLVAVVLLPGAMNLIPKAALAAILLHVGYKLAPIELFKRIFRQPLEQWMPFAVTVVAIVATDLLKGVGIGMAFGVFFILRAHMKAPYFIHRLESHEQGGHARTRIELGENVSFLNKASVNQVLHALPDDSYVEIDGRRARYIHPDVLELIHDFAGTAATRGIQVVLVDIPTVESLGGH